MSSRDDDVMGIALLFVGAFFFAVWLLSKKIGTDWDTALAFVWRGGVMTIGVLALFKFMGVGFVPCLFFWIGGIFFSAWPVLEYWSSSALANGGFIGRYNAEYEPLWYARWYSKAAFVAVPMVFGLFFWVKSENRMPWQRY